MPRSYHCRILAITAEVLDSDKLNVVSYRLILHGGKLVGATHVIVKVITNNDRHGRSCWLLLLLVPSLYGTDRPSPCGQCFVPSEYSVIGSIQPTLSRNGG